MKIWLTNGARKCVSIKAAWHDGQGRLASVCCTNVTKCCRKLARFSSKETAPNGTQTETTTTETTTVSEEATNSQPAPQPVAHGKAIVLPRYSAQVDFTPRLDADFYKPTGAALARRLGDSNAWLGAGYSWRTKEVTVFARVDF
jgi:hypothetical protein